MTDFWSPRELPATTNKIRAAMTSSPSSPECPEHKYSHETTLKDRKEAGDHLEQTQVPATPRTCRIIRALTCELNHTTQPAYQQDDTNAKEQIQPPTPPQDSKSTLNEIVITSPTSNEKCIPIFSAIALKEKKMLLGPMDFNSLSLDAPIDSLALVICLPESKLEKNKSISPGNIIKEMVPTKLKLQVANGDIKAPTETVQLQFEIGDWTLKETFIVATKFTGLILGLTFLKNNRAILDVSQALLHSPHLTYAFTAYENEAVSSNHKDTKRNQSIITPERTVRYK